MISFRNIIMPKPGIWVGNIPWSMCADDFFEHFSFACLPRPVALRFDWGRHGKARGEKYAAVELETWNDVDWCLQRMERWHIDPLPYFRKTKYMLIRPLNCRLPQSDNIRHVNRISSVNRRRDNLKFVGSVGRRCDNHTSHHTHQSDHLPSGPRRKCRRLYSPTRSLQPQKQTVNQDVRSVQNQRIMALLQAAYIDRDPDRADNAVERMNRMRYWDLMKTYVDMQADAAVTALEQKMRMALLRGLSVEPIDIESERSTPADPAGEPSSAHDEAQRSISISSSDDSDDSYDSYDTYSSTESAEAAITVDTPAPKTPFPTSHPPPKNLILSQKIISFAGCTTCAKSAPPRPPS